MLSRPAGLQLPIDVRRLSGASEPSPAPRKRGPRPSRKEAEENAVRRLLDQCVRAVEQDEARATTGERPWAALGAWRAAGAAAGGALG